MPLQRCYSLLSTARPIRNISTILTARFISKDNGLRQCLSKESDNRLDDITAAKPDTFSEHAKTDNRGYASDPQGNLNNAVSPSSIQRITISPPDEIFLDDHDVTLPSPLEKCSEDLSDIGPYLTPTSTFAKYANKSRTIQELVKLGVELYKLETKEDMIGYILALDFDRDIRPYITFLHNCGVPADYLGEFITKNPLIFKEDMDNLHTRIRYLKAHDFSTNMIKTIVCKNPRWLLFSTKDIDGRLGYFQSNFKLNGSQVRFLTVKGPKVVTYNMLHLTGNTFTIKEEMGFNPKQTQQLLLRLPKLWTKNRARLLSIFEYAHEEMQLQHDFLVQDPSILLCRKTRLQQRHSFLVELKRAQYDPSKPMYVSPKNLVSGTDIEFCRNIAKTSVEIYNTFLKTF